MYSCRKPHSRANASASRLCESGMEAESAVIAMAFSQRAVRSPAQVGRIGPARVGHDHFMQCLQDGKQSLLLFQQPRKIEPGSAFETDKTGHNPSIAARRRWIGIFRARAPFRLPLAGLSCYIAFNFPHSENQAERRTQS